MTTEDEMANLRRIPLFSLFETDALEKLAYSAEPLLLRQGDELFQRGAESDGGFILKRGAIGLETQDEAGGAEQVVEPWALIGEMALAAPSTRPATARALRSSTVLKVPRALFHQILEQHPATAARVRDFLRDRLLAFTRQAAALAPDD
jgi:CRP-like cAMP-binding protein